MPAIYVYKITADDGIAPCPQQGLLSLAVCKPAVRRKAQPGDFLVGIGSNVHYPDKLIYVAEVGEVVAGAVYYEKRGRYWKRFDCIYEHIGGPDYRWRNHGRRRVHDPAVMPAQMKRDVGFNRRRPNAVVLLSRRFVYFGRDRKGHSREIWRDFPEVLARARDLQQAHLVNHRPAFHRQLLDLCERVLGTCTAGSELDSPHHRPNAETCHDNPHSSCGQR
jgi:hypothetical protein